MYKKVILGYPPYGERDVCVYLGMEYKLLDSLLCKGKAFSFIGRFHCPNGVEFSRFYRALPETYNLKDAFPFDPNVNLGVFQLPIRLLQVYENPRKFWGLFKGVNVLKCYPSKEIIPLLRPRIEMAIFKSITFDSEFYNVRDMFASQRFTINWLDDNTMAPFCKNFDLRGYEENFDNLAQNVRTAPLYFKDLKYATQFFNYFDNVLVKQIIEVFKSKFSPPGFDENSQVVRKLEV